MKATGEPDHWLHAPWLNDTWALGQDMPSSLSSGCASSLDSRGGPGDRSRLGEQEGQRAVDRRTEDESDDGRGKSGEE